MRRKLTILSLLLALALWGTTAAANTLLDVSLLPSKTTLAPGENLDVAVWLYPGAISGGSLSLSSAEFNVIWDTPNLGPRSGVAPVLGPQLDPAWSGASFQGGGAAHLLAGWFSDITVDSTGLLLLTIPLTADAIAGPAALGIDFFMERDLGEPSFWAGGAPVDLAAVGSSGASVNVVPVPPSLILFGTGLAGLWLRSKRRV